MKGHEAEMDFVQRSPIPFDGPKYACTVR